MNKPSKSLIIFTTVSILVMIAVAVVSLNFITIKDFFTGLSYRPSEEMVEIRDSLALTTKGALIFNAVMPELMEKQEFNALCRDSESETAILGCYRKDRVYIYNITDDELAGIRELTSAHELLHAVYHRMKKDQKNDLKPLLEQLYEDNQALLGEEIDLYKDDQKLEEIYVRAGTEIANLPEKLEAHYAEIFQDQDKIANYYHGYISVFKEIEKTLKDLLEKAKTLETTITAKTNEYETSAASLKQEVDEFNNCANTANCFTSRWAFNNRRADLLNRQNELTNLYEEINQLISDYNQIVVEYNENLLHGQALNMSVNSLSRPE